MLILMKNHQRQAQVVSTQYTIVAKTSAVSLIAHLTVVTDSKPAIAPKSEGVLLNEDDRQAYEDMLHRDEAFWQDIEDRKTRLQTRREEQLKKKQAEIEAEAAAAAAAAEAKAAIEIEAAKRESEQTSKKQNSFSINDTDEDAVGTGKTIRKGSWDEEKDKELMSELESITCGASEKATEVVGGTEMEEKATNASNATSGSDNATGLSKASDELENLEKELGLQSLSTEAESLLNGKIDPELELLDAEFKSLEGLSPKADDEADDDLNFEADDFEELEEYLSGLSSK